MMELSPEDASFHATFTAVTGPIALSLPHIRRAISPKTHCTDLTRVVESNMALTFALTIFDVPWSTFHYYPGIIAHRIFVVNIQGITVQFVPGKWERTVRDCAFLRCYLLRPHGPFTEVGQCGLLRIPKRYVQTYADFSEPSPIPFPDAGLEDMWASIDTCWRFMAELRFPHNHDHTMAGSWSIPVSVPMVDERMEDTMREMRMMEEIGRRCHAVVGQGGQQVAREAGQVSRVIAIHSPEGVSGWSEEEEGIISCTSRMAAVSWKWWK